MRPLFSLADLHDSAAEIMFLGDRPAQHHAQPLHPAPPAGCFPCVVNKGACDAVFHERRVRSGVRCIMCWCKRGGAVAEILFAQRSAERTFNLRTRLAVRCGHLSSIPLQWPSGPHPLREARIERYWPCVCMDSSIDFECLLMYVRVNVCGPVVVQQRFVSGNSSYTVQVTGIATRWSFGSRGQKTCCSGT